MKPSDFRGGATMRALFCAAPLILLAAALTFNHWQLAAAATAGSGAAAPERSHYKLPALFDFQHFKSVFGKRYGSLLEELSRKRYFLSRALRAYVSGVNYKFRRAGHFNAVNELSDKSAEELGRMRNKLMEREEAAAAAAAAASSSLSDLNSGEEAPLPELLASADENIESELVDLVLERGHEPAFEELRDEMLAAGQPSRRRKRELESTARINGGGNLRALPMSRLINTGAGPDAHKIAAHQKALLRNPASNNPDYEPPELASFGLSDQQEQVKWWSVSEKSLRPVGAQLVESLERERELAAEPEGARGANLPDETFVDHREQGCLLEPRQQGACGACYAFAVTTLMEWLLCQKSGKLVALSEQYMIDCGKGRFQDTLAGCEGGSVQGSALFVHNFGLELAKHYPYLKHEAACPYEEQFDLKKTGFLRMELADAVDVQAKLWPRVLSRSPIYVRARTGADFVEYGGGVYLGAGCAPTTNHAMVLVGHGREDGQEFWLIRNSYGPNWGERGHWKLAKAAAARCLAESGVALGTKTGLKYEVKPRNSKPKAAAA